MKKFLSIALALILITVILCACSKNEKDKVNSDAEQSRIKYTFDSAYKSTDGSAVSAFEDLCDAVINYKSEIRMNTALLDSALQLLYTSFPLSELISDIKGAEDGSGVVISYKLSEEEHKKNVDSFISKTQEIINKCSEGTTNKGVFTVRVYNYIASSIVESAEATTCLDTVLGGKGTSYTYSQLFEYILRQKDIETYHVIAKDAAGNGWGLSGAMLYDNLYYFDIMTEFYANKGTQLLFFGMTTEDLKAEGLQDLLFTNQSAATDASDLRFDTCRKCTSWKLEGAKLLVTLHTKEIVEIAL